MRVLGDLLDDLVGWATNPDVSRRGYFARVQVSAKSPDDAQVPVRWASNVPAGATQVRTVGARRG